jgi:chromosome segregation ATPase
MFKKIGIASLAVLAGLVLWHKTSLGSYVGFAWKKAKVGVQKSMPLEWEIDRLREEVSRLVPDMKKELSRVAEEKVAIERLRKDISRDKDELAKRESEIKTMRTDLKSGASKFEYGERVFTAEKVKAKLARDWDLYRKAEENLKSREELLEARETGLTAALQKLSEMRSRKEQMEVKLAQLDVELKNLRVAQTKSDFQVDDTQISRCQQLLDEIQARIDTEKETMSLHGQFADGDIPVGTKVQTDAALKEIDERFGTQRAEAATTPDKK